MRLGVFLPNWVGDVVMATPALQTLRQYVGPYGGMIGIMRPYVADVLAGTHWLDEMVLYSKQANDGIDNWSDAQVRLRTAKLDSALLLTNSFRTGWMAWQSGARDRIGHTGNLRGWLLTRRVVPLRRSNRDLILTPIDAYLQLAEAFGCPAGSSNKMQLATTAADERAADEVWARLGLPDGQRVIVLNSGGAFGAAKHWPPSHFAELARRIVESGPYSVLVNCGPAERPIAIEIVARAAHRRVAGLAECKDLPVGLTKACIRRARMLVSTDSGPRFFGLAFDKPVVTLFGPTDPAATVTYDENETPLSLGLDCQPCKQRTCPLVHHRCMQDLSRRASIRRSGEEARAKSYCCASCLTVPISVAKVANQDDAFRRVASDAQSVAADETPSNQCQADAGRCRDCHAGIGRRRALAKEASFYPSAAAKTCADAVLCRRPQIEFPRRRGNCVD